MPIPRLAIPSLYMIAHLILLEALLLHCAIATNSDCSCGYSVNSTSDPSHAVFTEILETNFLDVSSVTDNPCWQPQAYNVSVADAHGEYGKMATPQNVVANPLRSGSQSMGVLGGDAGLQLWVKSSLVDDKVPMAEIVAKNNNIAYGSFRVGMKVTAVPGTCSAFFWYRDNTEEIDMEFLSSEFNETSQPVFLVMQSPPSAQVANKAVGISTYAIIKLPFAPGQGFHEYRFDWTPEVLSFYADGAWVQDMFYKYSDAAGHLTLNHWSNGNQKWSKGPPKSNAVTTISYVKAYFNSSDPTKQNMYNSRCPDQHDETKICQIPDQLSWPVDDKRPFFFSGSMCGERHTTSTLTETQSTASSKEMTSTSTTSLTTATVPHNPSTITGHSLSEASSLFNAGGFFRGFVLGLPIGIMAIAGAYN